MHNLAQELETIDLGDQRLNRRAQQVIEALGAQPSASIPVACGGWAETKAAYRLFAHERVEAQQLLEPHYQCSEQRIAQHPRVLCIQDSTELAYTGKGDIAGLGPLNYEKRQGLYLHPTLAVTPERLCLGVIDAWMWRREPGSLSAKPAAHRPIEDKESIRWVEGYQRVNELAERIPTTRVIYMADREADIYEVCAEHERARDAQAHWAEWLIRAA
jgi:Transposase DNA-binding